MASLRSDMRNGYERCSRSLLSEVAEQNCACGSLYHSEVDTQLRAYESTIRQRVPSILASLDHSLEDLRRDDASANPQKDSDSVRSTPLQQNVFALISSVVTLQFGKSLYVISVGPSQSFLSSTGFGCRDSLSSPPRWSLVSLWSFLSRQYINWVQVNLQSSPSILTRG